MARLAGVRSGLLILAFALTMPTVGLQLWRAADDRHEALERARARVSELARIAALEEDDSLQEASNLLRVLKHVPSVVAGSPSECHGFLREITNEHPRIDVLSVINPDGLIACTSLQPVPPAFSLTDRTWFQEVTAQDAPTTVISELLISRQTRLPTIIVASGLAPSTIDASRGAISATMNLSWFSDIATRVHGPSNTSVLITDVRDGSVLAQSMAAEKWVGKRFLDHPLVQTFRSSAEGTAEVLGLDGTMAIVAFRRLSGDLHSHAVVSVGIPRSLVLIEANRHLVHGLLATGLTLVLGMLAAWVVAEASIIRPLEALSRMAERLGCGDLATRAIRHRHAVAELQKLGEMFNRAAGQIEQRDIKLEQLALKDPLTGLANRRCFDAALATEWGRSARIGQSLALVMVDVDYFKLFNDAYGHPAGDTCLRHVAAAIAANVRTSTDVVARYGGEEIAVVIPHIEISDAIGMAERIVDAIRDLGIPHSGSPFGRVTVSAGVAARVACRGMTTDPQELLRTADAALYEAKRAGRNRVVTTGNASVPALA